MKFTINDKRLIKWIWVKKNYAEKRLLMMFLTEDEALMRYQCEISNFVDLCSGVGIVWSTTTREHESMMPLLILSPLNV